MTLKTGVFSLILTAGVICVGCDSSDPAPELPPPREVAESDYIVTDSGLKYFDFSEGDTTLVLADSGASILMHYSGWLEDGTMFDSSVFFSGVPIAFVLNVTNLIEGFEEGVTGMYPGGDRQIVIPPELGYGSSGTSTIPPNSTLIFEVLYLGQP